MATSIKEPKEVKEKEGITIDREKKRRRTIKTEPRSASPLTSDIKKIIVKSETKPKNHARVMFLREEELMNKRDPAEDVQIHKRACEELQKVMQRIHKLKQIGDSEEEIERWRIHGVLQFVTLKKLNRQAHIRIKMARDATNEKKQTIELHHLELQNLLYEVMHLQKEITKCLEFQSKDEEINLVPLEEFYKEAPKDISRPDVTQNDPHSQTIARLDWELEQRKQLAEKLSEAQGSKHVIAEEIKTQQQYLESLQPKLNAILASTKPVQDYLELPFDESREQHRTAAYLPRPLYVLYMHASAFKDACDKKLSVHIVGDVDVAKALDPTAPEVDDDSGDSDQEEQEKKSTKRRRRISSAGDAAARKKQRILKKHPLSIVLDITCKDNSVLSLTFDYLLALEIVTVTVKLNSGTDTISSVSGGDLLSPEYLLTGLYPNDFGLDTPNPANRFILSRIGAGEFSSLLPEAGRPYQWAQALAGLNFLGVGDGSSAPLAAHSEVALSASRMEQTIARLRRRVTARQALSKQLLALEHRSIPVPSEYQSMYPAKVSATLSEWKLETYGDFKNVGRSTQNILSAGLAYETDLFFMGTMERGSAKLTFHVAVNPDYPATAPVFAVSVNWKDDRTSFNDEHIREMEAEVNVHYSELTTPGTACDYLLTNQLQRLAMCFDVYLETESDNSAIEGPIEFAKEKIFPRFSRGPSRGKPYRFMSQMGFFAQR